VASYIPWLCHELPDGGIDVTGSSRPERDVAAFIDLCAEHGLWFIARPGPFVMAELKNEGLPYRLYERHPEISPVGWDGGRAPSHTADYLAPAYLTEVRRWYDAIMPVLADRLQPRGGNVIAVQLDNEVGMLAWVTNSPDLTDHLLEDFRDWLKRERPADLADRYPVDLDDGPAWARAVRSPEERWSAALRVDLGTFMRARFARYVQTLREFAEASGVREVPFIVNIHGTEGGSADSFPIGISQLLQTYSGVDGVISGSDHYVGDMTIPNTAGLYVLNAFSDAAHDDDQPLTSVEFDAGDGDYGGGFDQQFDPSTVDLKTRLFVAQGNRLINYYLFAGGINGPLDEPVGDGNDRIGTTGERHGRGAPVGPEGQHNPPYAPLAGVVAAVRANAPWLSRMREEHDDLALGFVPDAYMTEYQYPGSQVMRAIREDLVAHRGVGARRALARSLLLAGYRFGAVDLQRDDPTRSRRVVVLATGRHLAEAVQHRLVDHLRGGGGLVLLGQVPEADLEGRPCGLLADALGLRVAGMGRFSRGWHPAVTGSSWLAPRPEIPVAWTQRLRVERGDVILREAVTGEPCGVAVTCGPGRAVVLTAELPADPQLFRTVVEHVGANPGLTHDAGASGLFATTTVDDGGGRLLHVLNVGGYPNSVHFQLDDVPLLGGRSLDLPARGGRMLPLGLRVPAGMLHWSTAEIRAADEDSVTLDLLMAEEAIALETDRSVTADVPIAVDRQDGVTVVTARTAFPRPARISLA
jgi:beta-galactosidase